jgi:uncharacterized protein (TIGR00251 family)
MIVAGRSFSRRLFHVSLMTKKKQTIPSVEVNSIALPAQCFSLPTGQKNKNSTNMYIKVAVKPGSKQNNIVLIDPTLQEMSVQVAAPPTEGEANQELCEYIAQVLQLRKSQVGIHAGHKSRNKVLSMEDVMTSTDQQTNQKKLKELYDRLSSARNN